MHPHFGTDHRSYHARMQCSNCHHQIEDPEALFCAQCGQSLCIEGHCCCCGKRLQPNANFCDRCGAPVAVEPTTPSMPIMESLKVISPPATPFRGGVQAEVRHHVEQAQAKRTVERKIQREKAHQAARLLKYGLRENDWISIAGGSFLMGSPAGEKNRFENERQHEVEVKQFEILKTPVTFAMFDIYCKAIQSSFPGDETWGRGNRPVINVSYWSALEYCQWLGEKIDAPIRLPTEAEWEYACRAGTDTPFWTGQSISPDQANFDGNYTYGGSEKGLSRGQTTPVDQFPANPWGLHDMHGNVWEWCASIYDETYSGLELQDAGFDYEDHRERVVRGGSWHNVPSGLRSASRNKLRPDYHYLRVGFRIVREVTTNGV